MTLQSVLALVVLALASTIVAGQLNFNYYCDRALSCYGVTNSMCGKIAMFSQYCRNPQYVVINSDLKARFLEAHNTLRNYLALGGPGYIFSNKIADMATMSWDDELELMSLTNALQCKMSTDQCRRTAKYPVVGQNVYEYCSSPQAPPVEDVIWKSVNSWFDNYVHVPNINEMHRSGSTNAPKQALLFTQMVQSQANRIGCSAIRHVDHRNLNCVIIGCNYNVGNLANYPVNKFGPTASQCRLGNNPKHPALCHPNEDYTQHEFGNVYFNKNALASPTLAQWLNNGKRLDGYVHPAPAPAPGPGWSTPAPNPIWVTPAPTPGWNTPAPAPVPGWVTPAPTIGWVVPAPNPGWNVMSMNSSLSRPIF